MKQINDLLNVYQNKISNKLIELAKPLDTHFGINEFIYTFIGHDGKFFALSNQPSASEFYFLSKFYQSTQLIRHPDNYGNEAILPIVIPNEKQENSMGDKFGLYPDNLLVLFKRDKHDVHKFLFNTNRKGVSLIPFYINNLHVLELFCSHFLSEWLPYKMEMEKYIIDIGTLIGPQFFEIKPSVQYAKELEHKMAFFKEIGTIPQSFTIPNSFTDQEVVCLKWIHQGKTIKETASFMQLSPRTVEHYFDNIKIKMGCYSKGDVMEKLGYLHILGVI